jgi:hypothetical protein
MVKFKKARTALSRVVLAFFDFIIYDPKNDHKIYSFKFVTSTYKSYAFH